MLPPEVFEALYWLGEGESLEEVEKAMALEAHEPVDTADFARALARDATKRRFVVVEDDLTLEAMLDAPSFYRDEWELVVQPQGCESWEDYKKASRSGRGARMSRAQRKAAWPVFEEYRHLLEKNGFREPEDALRDATAMLLQGKVRLNLRSILVDEAQDMSTNAFALLRAALGVERADDLFIVGDGHQRIYRKRVVLSRAGVNIRGRGRRLRINYRTTDEIRRYAVALLEGEPIDDLDAGTDSTRGYRSLMHGEVPELQVHPSFDDEVEAIARWLTDVTLPHACLVARTNQLVARYADALEDRGVPTWKVRRSVADDPSKPGLRVATMHRVKGLEYDRIVIAGVTEEAMPLKARIERSGDRAVRREAELHKVPAAPLRRGGSLPRSGPRGSGFAASRSHRGRDHLPVV